MWKCHLWQLTWNVLSYLQIDVICRFRKAYTNRQLAWTTCRFRLAWIPSFSHCSGATCELRLVHVICQLKQVCIPGRWLIGPFELVHSAFHLVIGVPKTLDSTVRIIHSVACSPLRIEHCPINVERFSTGIPMNQGYRRLTTEQWRRRRDIEDSAGRLTRPAVSCI
jgi:hypothetical protein